MTELLASYWRSPVPSGRTVKTAYLDLFSDGRSANVVMFVDKWKCQLPKWVLRDFLSLAAVTYPDAALNRRENPERVTVEDAMTARLAAAGFRYAPGSVNTYLPDASVAPKDTFKCFESMDMIDRAQHTNESRAEAARQGGHKEMFRMIESDVAEAKQKGEDMTKWEGVDSVCAAHGWTRFEVTIVMHTLRLYVEHGVKR